MSPTTHYLSIGKAQDKRNSRRAFNVGEKPVPTGRVTHEKSRSQLRRRGGFSCRTEVRRPATGEDRRYQPYNSRLLCSEEEPEIQGDLWEPACGPSAVQGRAPEGRDDNSSHDRMRCVHAPYTSHRKDIATDTACAGSEPEIDADLEPEIQSGLEAQSPTNPSASIQHLGYVTPPLSPTCLNDFPVCGACFEGDCDRGVSHRTAVAEETACTCCGLVPSEHY